MEKNMSKNYIGYIYIIKNRIDESKVYIGQTRTSLSQRWTQHKSAARHDTKYSSVLYNAINKYGEDNFEISQLEKIISESKDDLINKLNKLEIYYIKYYNSLVPNGYNITKGGDNTSIRFQKSVTSYFPNGEVDKVFESASEASRFYNNGNNSNTTSIIRWCNGKLNSYNKRIWRYSEDPFEKFPVISKEKIEKGKMQPVDKYTLDKKFIKSYDSIVGAIKDDELVKNPSPIRECCDGKLNQAYGYIWRYKNEDVDKYEWKYKKYTAVDVYSIDGELLNSFKSISDAQNFYGIKNNAHILSCCNGQRSTCKNMVWRFQYDSFDKYSIERKKRKDQYIFNRYDLQNNYIETIYGTKQLPNSRESVIDCCNGLRTHINDSKWFFANDLNNPDKSKIIGIPRDYNSKNNISIIFDKFIEPICVYDRYGNFIKEYKNAKELSKETNIYSQIIYDVCDGKYAYHKGFVFRYKKDSFYLYYNFKYISKHINVYDVNDNFLMECFDVKECVRQLNLNTKRGSSIDKCITHERKYAYGYQFFRVTDPTQPDKSKIITIDNFQQREA